MTDAHTIDFESTETPFSVSVPDLPGADQDEEWIEVEFEGRDIRIRMHDYAALYEIPGLYEFVVYQALRCQSPENVVSLLESSIQAAKKPASHLRVLDLGAGNGVVAEHLRRIGVREIVGMDIIPEAAMAARRDRPSIYDDYVVADAANLTSDDERRLRRLAPNCLVTVAALGFGDVQPEAFVGAFNLLAANGWLAMTIRDRFLSEDDPSGFGRLIRGLITDGTIEIEAQRRYVHRLSLEGEELFYVALIARKRNHAHVP